MRWFVLLTITLTLLFCSSSPKPNTAGVLYERKPADKEAAIAQSGQVIYSKARIDPLSSGAKVIYYYYIFQQASKTELTFSYEEYYGKIKEKADLKESKTIPYTNGEAVLDEIKLILYQVSPNSIEYKLETLQ